MSYTKDGNLFCICGHLEKDHAKMYLPPQIYLEAVNRSYDNIVGNNACFDTSSGPCCKCLKFKSDNLKYLENKYKEYTNE